MTTTYDEKPELPFAGEGEALRQELRQVRDELRQMTELVRQANERADANMRALEAFKVRVAEVGGQYAERNDWCSTYDEILEELGLPGRLTEWTVSVRCHYETEVHGVMARSESNAQEMVREAGVVWNFSPPSMIEGFRTYGVSDAQFEVVDD